MDLIEAKAAVDLVKEDMIRTEGRVLQAYRLHAVKLLREIYPDWDLANCYEHVCAAD